MTEPPRVAVLGAGLAGCSSALALAASGLDVDLIDKSNRPMSGASCHNEGKLHLGYIYAAERRPQTYRIVSEGSLRFFDFIEELTGVAAASLRVSTPFIYVVPSGSQLELDDIVGHFERVDRLVTARKSELGSTAPMSGTWGHLTERQRAQHFSDDIVAAIQTGEIAVDAHQIASIVAAAVLSHPAISFKPNQTVTAADRSRDGRYRVVIDGDADNSERQYAGVVNALWEGRLHVDQTIGITSAEPWLWRWKAAVSISGAVEPPLPATTALLGAYGDFVEYGKSRSYISWYPACLGGMTNELGPDPLRSAVSRLDHDEILRETVKGMSALVPGIASIPRLEERARVGGGYIMAIGETDIDDPTSGLHERHQIGPVAHDGWVSLETGKYCTAPMFGIEAAHQLVAHLGLAS